MSFGGLGTFFTLLHVTNNDPHYGSIVDLALSLEWTLVVSSY